MHTYQNQLVWEYSCCYVLPSFYCFATIGLAWGFPFIWTFTARLEPLFFFLPSLIIVFGLAQLNKLNWFVSLRRKTFIYDEASYYI